MAGVQAGGRTLTDGRSDFEGQPPFVPMAVLAAGQLPESTSKSPMCEGVLGKRARVLSPPRRLVRDTTDIGRHRTDLRPLRLGSADANPVGKSGAGLHLSLLAF